METYTHLLLLLAATLRVATPLVLAALAGLFSERAGVVALGLEGKLLAGAFAAASVAALSGSPWWGLLAGMGAGVLVASVLAYACLVQRGNQVVAGMALNLLVAGLAPTLALAWFGLGGQTPQLEGVQRFLGLPFPWTQVAREHPVPGLFYAEVLAGHNLLVYVAFALVPLSAWVYHRSRFGLRLRAAGENPGALEAAGVSVFGLRWRALCLCGALCGAAGAYLSTAASAGFVRDMSAGKGYLALAALIFGKWRPWPTAAACLLFAFMDALAVRLQGVSLPLLGELPVPLVLALPYVFTLVILAGFVGRSRAPAALGKENAG